MERVLFVAAFGIAVLCGLLLLLWIIQALRGKRAISGRMAATIVGMSGALWQAYVLNPAVGINLAYFLGPIALVSVLLILSRGLKDAMSEPPSEGPDVKIPAVAMRRSAGMSQELHEEQKKKIAAGE